MTEKVKPWKKLHPSPTITLCPEYYQCPDCGGVITVEPVDMFGFYYCPYCGKERYEDTKK